MCKIFLFLTLIVCEKFPLFVCPSPRWVRIFLVNFVIKFFYYFSSFLPMTNGRYFLLLSCLFEGMKAYFTIINFPSSPLKVMLVKTAALNKKPTKAKDEFLLHSCFLFFFLVAIKHYWHLIKIKQNERIHLVLIFRYFFCFILLSIILRLYFIIHRLQGKLKLVKQIPFKMKIN